MFIFTIKPIRTRSAVLRSSVDTSLDNATSEQNKFPDFKSIKNQTPNTPSPPDQKPFGGGSGLGCMVRLRKIPT